MVERDVVEKQLHAINAMPKFFGRPEVEELPNILFDGEVISHLVIGKYEGGWASLVATDRRILLVDKKPFYLTIEDIRYDMVSDVQYDHRLLDATVRLGTMHKTVNFLSYSREKLRKLTTYAQEQVSMMSNQAGQSVFQTMTAAQDDQPVRVPLSEAAKVTLRGVSGALDDVRQMRPTLLRPRNPYRSSTVFRRRVSRFY